MGIYSIAKKRPLHLVLMLAGFELLWLGNMAGAQTQQEEITVVAPREVERKTVGRAYSGAPIEEISVSYQVAYDDLDLKKPADVDTLRTRIAGVAKEACKDVYQLPPYFGVRSQQDCIRKSIKSATKQIDAAVAARQGYGNAGQP